MARQPHHSRNWGGARPNSGGKKTGPNKMTAKAIAMAEAADIHPFQYLLSVVADREASTKDRLNAAVAAAPYCLSKRATEIHVTNDMDGKSNQELRDRLASIHIELLGLNPVIEGELVQ